MDEQTDREQRHKVQEEITEQSHEPVKQLPEEPAIAQTLHIARTHPGDLYYHEYKGAGILYY